VWMRILGVQYAHAATALRVLSTVFVLTYVAILYASTLVMIGRAWTLTWITLAGLVVNGALNLLFVRYSVPMLGEGGGGTGCAAAMLCTEVFVSACMVVWIGRGAFDRRSAGIVVRSLLVSGVVVIAHVLLASLGPARLVVDAALYFALAIATGALRPRDMVATVSQALRKDPAAP